MDLRTKQVAPTSLSVYSSTETVEAQVGPKDVRVNFRGRVERGVVLLAEQVPPYPRRPF
ncbi:MAG: hypothetical protein M0Z45_02800 [Actinomycetota bacterium]|nr:hypothetical protein [Actinomycetota bacterium]